MSFQSGSQNPFGPNTPVSGQKPFVGLDMGISPVSSSTITQKPVKKVPVDGYGIAIGALSVGSAAISDFSNIAMNKRGAENNIKMSELQTYGDAALSEQSDLNRIESERQARIEDEFKREGLEIERAKSSFFDRMQTAQDKITEALTMQEEQSKRAQRVTDGTLTEEERQELIKASNTYKL